MTGRRTGRHLRGQECSTMGWGRVVTCGKTWGGSKAGPVGAAFCPSGQWASPREARDPEPCPASPQHSWKGRWQLHLLRWGRGGQGGVGWPQPWVTSVAWPPPLSAPHAGPRSSSSSPPRVAPHLGCPVAAIRICPRSPVRPSRGESGATPSPRPQFSDWPSPPEPMRIRPSPPGGAPKPCAPP